MEQGNGFIKLYRKVLDWGYFEDSHMVHMLVYMLLSSSFKDQKYRGVEIKKGQILTSLGVIHRKTNMSLQTIRTCLKKMERDGIIEQKTTKEWRLITICNYDNYIAQED